MQRYYHKHYNVHQYSDHKHNSASANDADIGMILVATSATMLGSKGSSEVETGKIWQILHTRFFLKKIMWR